ncbi:MAG TPA: dynamin family protein [Vicinamibacterales bacterium]|nr:dynamin family protein [Vicinamibacterales bacterium]
MPRLCPVQGVLTTDLQSQLNGGRELLAQLRDALMRFGASDEDKAALASSIRQLDEFFMLVVVGEFNSGKSAFINALVGRQVVKEGVTPTTAQIHVLKYGDTIAQSTDAQILGEQILGRQILGKQDIAVTTAPAEFLREVQIVDTPGTNAIIREHERITTTFVPRADLVLFVTSADRPFTETERAFLETIRAWGKKIVIIVNKVDIFERPDELDEVLAFVTSASQRLLGMTPELFAVSARLALRAKQGEPSVWTASRFEPLERYITDTLDEASRFRIKLANPLGVGEALAQRYAAIASERLTLLKDDLTLLENVEQQLALYRSDLARGFELRMTAVEKVLLDMETRGHAFFEDTLRIGRVMDLFNRARIQKEFEERVVADAPRQIERAVTELIDWLIDQDFRQWQAVTTAIAARTREHGSRVLGAPEVGTFHSDRGRLIDAVGREAQRVVDTYDRKREAAVIADHARTAVTTAAAAGGGALALGTVVTLAATTAAADITGILLASVVATLGFLVIPARRRKAKGELKNKMSALRERLATALRAEFDRAQVHSRQRLDDVVAPYSRFVRAEQERWTSARDALGALRDQAGAFRKRLAA